MKKFLNGLLVAIGVMALSIVTSLGYNHYVAQETPDAITEDTMDWNVQVNDAVMQVINPTFMSIDEVYRCRMEMVDMDSINQAFMSIPIETLTDISKVLIGNEGWTSKKAIVEEYRNRYDSIYKHLTHESNNPPSDTAVVISDTVINGVPYKKLTQKPVK